MPPVTTVFQRNVAFVYELLDFDKTVFDPYLENFEDWAQQLEKTGNRNMATNVRHRIQSLKNIRNNESLKSRYETIYNQCVVLLVSHFGSAMHAVFRNAVKRGLVQPSDMPVKSYKIETSWEDLMNSDEGPPALLFADMLIAYDDVSFQDMGSIARAFVKHLGLEIPRGEPMNDIILGQAARHVIVHAGAFVDKKMIKQVSAAKPRTLKLDLKADAYLHFDADEVKALGQTMEHYVAALVDLVDDNLPKLKLTDDDTHAPA